MMGTKNTMEEEKLSTYLRKVQDFIYSDKVQNDLDEINNLLLPINVLDIAGMGNQEIKHSNVLAWMFGDNQHQLGHKILAKFLGHVASIEGDNKNDDKLTSLRHYAYFPEHKRDIHIKREWNNIDLLIEDKANNVVIVIENKVWASESEHQIVDYEKATDCRTYPRRNISEKPSNGEFGNSNTWDVHYIFLTPDGAEVKNIGNENWLCANYSTVYAIIRDNLEKSNQDIPAEARFILDSYNDLLIKENIVANDKLQELCAKIWRNNKDALDILMANRPDNIKAISAIIWKNLIDSGVITQEIEEIAKKRQQQRKGNIFRFPTESTKSLDFEFYLEFSRRGFYLGIEKCPDELQNKFKNKNNQLSKRFYKNGEMWERHIESEISPENLDAFVIGEMVTVIEEIKKWEKNLVSCNNSL